MTCDLRCLKHIIFVHMQMSLSISLWIDADWMIRDYITVHSNFDIADASKARISLGIEIAHQLYLDSNILWCLTSRLFS